MGRATDLDELWALMARLFPNGSQDNDAFEPRPSDVILAPFAKCGTTWLHHQVPLPLPAGTGPALGSVLLGAGSLQ